MVTASKRGQTGRSMKELIRRVESKFLSREFFFFGRFSLKTNFFFKINKFFKHFIDMVKGSIHGPMDRSMRGTGKIIKYLATGLING